jgi:hypothetical protein
MGGQIWEYEVLAVRHIESHVWFKVSAGTFETLDPQSPEFRDVPKEHVMAILLQARVKNA